MTWRKTMPALTLVCLAVGISATSCVLQTPPPASSNAQPPAPTETPPPEPFVEVPEMTFAAADRLLPDGPIAGLTGLYGQYGSPILVPCRVEQNRMFCRRYPVQLEASRPQVIEVIGQIDGGELSVDSWKPFPWDEAGQQAAAQAHLEHLAPALAGYDWSQIARPDFAESSSQYQLSEEEIKNFPLELTGYDTAGNRMIWRAQGPEMPEQKALVHRYSALYILTDPAGKMPSEMFVTIEGHVEE